MKIVADLFSSLLQTQQPLTTNLADGHKLSEQKVLASIEIIWIKRIGT